MTVDTLHPAPAPAVSRLGQATAVEQSRAVAEVAAAVQVAQMCPRDVAAATAEMRRACAQPKLAERAFFRYNRGDGTVTGASVYLARELARCWGNVQSGVAELRRDDEHGQSEMQAWAWDVQTNTRNSTTFIVPHARDTKKGRRDLTELRDVYENNANNAARRLREMILGLLPQWFVEDAKDICTTTIRDGNGKPLADRIAEAIATFEAELRVDRTRLERRIGHPSSAWTAHDVATLRVIFSSLRRGEITVEDEFPVEQTPTVTAADLGPAPAPAAPAAAKAPGGSAAAPAPPTPSTSGSTPGAAEPARIDRGTWDRINSRFNEIGVNGTGQKQARLIVVRHIADRPDTAQGSDLTADQGQLILDNLAGIAGARLVAGVLRAADAPEHLIPQVTEEQPAPVEEPIGGHAHEHDPQTGAPLADDVAVALGEDYDPTTEPDWSGAQQYEDAAARDEAAAE